MLDYRDPFFSKPWRRYALLGATLAWMCLELVLGNVAWAGFFAAIAIFIYWKLFWVPHRDGHSGSE